MRRTRAIRAKGLVEDIPIKHEKPRETSGLIAQAAIQKSFLAGSLVFIVVVLISGLVGVVVEKRKASHDVVGSGASF